MEIKKFVMARKAKGLSQQELAKGICTQATISRFEKNGQIPSLKILTKLCERVGLSLEDLFPKVDLKTSAVEKEMEEIEFLLVVCDYHEAYQKLKALPEEKLTEEQHLRYLYLQGFLTVLLGMDITDALFDFNQILLQEKAQEEGLYTLLAYTGSGLAYLKMKELKKAEFFYKKVLQEIQTYQPENHLDLWRTLTAVFFTAEFYAQTKERPTSDALLRHGLRICRENHVTYYVARIFLQLALNAMEEGAGGNVVGELLQDAYSFSKFNGNVKELEILKELRTKYPFT